MVNEATTANTRAITTAAATNQKVSVRSWNASLEGWATRTLHPSLPTVTAVPIYS